MGAERFLELWERERRREYDNWRLSLNKTEPQEREEESFNEHRREYDTL